MDKQIYIDEMLLQAIAMIFEVPEVSVEDNPEWYLVELGLLLQKVEVQDKLKRYMKKVKWKNKEQWYGVVEE